MIHVRELGNEEMGHLEQQSRNSNITSSMSLKRSARFGSFNAVTSFMAALTDFSSERSFTSSVALISLSPRKEIIVLLENR